MGGIGGEIRAKTQEEAWTTLHEEVQPQVEEAFGLFLEAPLTREAAYTIMRQDPSTRDWVLDYHFSK